MISHTTCAHASTPGERAKCRRARANGEEVKAGFKPPLFSLGPPILATPKVIQERERNRGTTPRDRDKQCDVCGVERTIAWGKDRLRDLHLYVGERCFYYLDPESEIKVLP